MEEPKPLDAGETHLRMGARRSQGPSVGADSTVGGRAHRTEPDVRRRERYLARLGAPGVWKLRTLPERIWEGWGVCFMHVQWGCKGFQAGDRAVASISRL